MNTFNESERVKRQIFLQIKNWLFKSYSEYEPKVETKDILSISYIEIDRLYKLSIQLCHQSNMIRYFVELPFSIESKHYNVLLEKINEHHLKACIGRYELDKQRGVLIFNNWTSYDVDKLDFNIIDRGMGIAMICCKERFGLLGEEGDSYEQDDSYVRWINNKDSSANNHKVN